MMFIRYIIIQLLAYALDMGGFVLILKIGIFEPLIANVGGKVVAGSFAFIAHRNLTFRSNETADKNRQAIRYFVMLALYVPFSTAILSFFLMWIKEPEIAKLLSDGICVVISYLISRKFIFTNFSQANH